MAFDRTADELVSAQTEGNESRIEAITMDPPRRRCLPYCYIGRGPTLARHRG